MPKGTPAPRGVRNFPATCARLLLSHTKGRSRRALDLGCAVGRASFELAKRVPEVVGIDYSRSFVAAAKRIQRSGRIRFPLQLEGSLTQPTWAHLPHKIARQRVCFKTGDALRPDKGLGTFDLVLAANLIDRLSDPKRFLTKILPFLVNPGGFLLLTSPYTWSSEFTPRNRWLRDSFSRIRALLRPHFRLVHREDLPFLIREHRRKFQYSFADATVWLRTSSSS